MTKTVVLIWRCGGTGDHFGDLVLRRTGHLPGIAWRAIDTATPPGTPKARSIELNPQLLPDTPTRVVADLLRLTPLSDHEEYRRYRGLVSARGLAQAPFMTTIAAFLKLADFKEAIEADVRTCAEAVGGADHLFFLTIASGLGATGTPSARAAGLAFRLASRGAYLPAGARWLHVFVSSSVLGDACRNRRTLALERRQLEEIEALMSPGASLRVPGQLEAIPFPGPDQLVVIGSSPEAPRTLDDAADELGAVIAHWIS